jgi:transcriptional regulator with XRE-family HTH domain|tara:strand:- start:3 stop:299 length:297 start_codon:yes stop_codon:yes gene_type:complete
MEKRFQKWLNSEDISATQLSNNINVSRAAISHILSGRNKPSIDFLDKILNKYPNINLNWLVSGIGNMSYIIKDASIKKKNIKKVIVFYDDTSFDELIN